MQDLGDDNSIREHARTMNEFMLVMMNSYIDYYLAVGNDLTVTIPGALNDIFDALMKIVSSIKNVISDPFGVISSVTGAVTT